jgi:glycyl-tRNA synthetase beta chain
MGRYYALNDGLSTDVADAIEDHYKPRFAGDSLPRNQVGVVVALADKLETLVGMFGIGNSPTGDKDPFALRRHALGLIRILIERNIDIDLPNLLVIASRVFIEWLNPSSANTQFDLGEHERKEHIRKLVSDVEREFITQKLNLSVYTSGFTGDLPDFIYERLAGTLRDQGYRSQEIDAVLTLRPERLADVSQRLAAVRAFASLPEAPALAAANKRISNILKKEESVHAVVDAALLQEPAEIALFAAMDAVAPKAKAQFEAGDYTASLQSLAALRAPVDAFFDGVMVNAEDLALRKNRQGLLKTLHEAMNRVADLSKLAT